MQRSALFAGSLVGTQNFGAKIMVAFFRVFFCVVFFSMCTLVCGEDAAPITPTDSPIRLFNGKNLEGLYTWLSDAKYEDPRKVFTVEDGLLHISGNGMGYICTKQRYKDYHLVAEYRWGEKTWLSRVKAARDSGIIVHCVEPDGSCINIFMAGIEAQIIEGGTGDLLFVSGKRADGSPIVISATAETIQGPSGATIWHKGGQRTVFNKPGTIKRIDWYGAIRSGRIRSTSAARMTLKAPARSGRDWT